MEHRQISERKELEMEGIWGASWKEKREKKSFVGFSPLQAIPDNSLFKYLTSDFSPSLLSFTDQDHLLLKFCLQSPPHPLSNYSKLQA